MFIMQRFSVGFYMTSSAQRGVIFDKFQSCVVVPVFHIRDLGMTVKAGFSYYITIFVQLFMGVVPIEPVRIMT